MLEWNLISDNSNYQIYRIVKNNKYLSWKNVMQINNKTNNCDFASSFVTLLESAKFKSYYLEFSPVSSKNYDTIPFEFILIKTNGFNNNADIKTFGEEKLDTNSNNIAVFPNKTNTSILHLFH